MTIRLLCALALVLGAALPAAAEPFAFTFTADDQGAVTGLGVVTRFTTTIRNTGTSPDTYTVTMAKDMDAAWSCSFCQGTTCYPPFVQQISFPLAPGAETLVDVDLTPMTNQGSGEVLVTVASIGSPSLAGARTFRVVTTGVQVLLVDGDGGQQLEDYYVPALAAGEVTWARWPRDEAGALEAPELSGFAAVIWFANGVAPGLDDADRSALAYYLQHGGTLLLIGEDLARQACDPGSPWYSAQAAAWFEVVLGAGYGGSAAGATRVAGMPGAPFGSGFWTTLNNVGGANNSVAPAGLLALGSGVIAQTYGSSLWAAVASTWGSGRSLYCGYQVESFASGVVIGFVDEFLDWALGRPSSVPGGLPGLMRAVDAVPNPFNPTTELRLVAAAPGLARAEICDVRGRVVRRLEERVGAAGPLALVWDGRDGRGIPLPSGVYVARVSAPGIAGSTKLVLAK